VPIPFQPESTDPRLVIAQVLSERDGRPEIRPMIWADAGALVKALRVKGLLVDRRNLASQERTIANLRADVAHLQSEIKYLTDG